VSVNAVVAVQDTFLDGEVERGAQGGAQVPHHRRRLRPALAVGGRRDPGEDGPQQTDVEVGEPVGAEVRDQDDVDVAGVVKPG
jgi:hypothetical protein